MTSTNLINLKTAKAANERLQHYVWYTFVGDLLSIFDHGQVCSLWREQLFHQQISTAHCFSFEYSVSFMGFYETQLVKNLPAFAGVPGSIPVSGRSAGRDRLPTPVFLGFPGVSAGKESTCNVGDLGFWSLGWENLLKKATHSSILAWRIPWTV